MSSQSVYTNRLQDSGNVQLHQKLLVATPTLGSVRMEWAAARYGQMIPTNWSKMDVIQYLSSFIPYRYSVADAQNLIVHEAISEGYEWLLLIEDDTIPPPDAFIRFNEYMRKADVPVVSGLYFTRADPAEPMIYRERGNGYYGDWKLGDKVWVWGVPTGMLLLDVRLLKLIYEDSPEYSINGTSVRRVFNTPLDTWFNEKKGVQEARVGSSDLDFCTRVIEAGYLGKHWPELARKQYPFLVDTNIACMHIDRHDGTQFPIEGIGSWCESHGNLKQDGKG